MAEDYSRLSKLDRLFLLGVHMREIEALQPMLVNVKQLMPDQRLARLRVSIRTIHSMIESSLALMSSSVLAAVDDGKFSVSEKDRDFLLDRGQSAFVKRARGVIRCFAGLHNAKGKKAIQLPEQISNWTPLRHRITHPKKPSDLTVQTGDLKAFSAVVTWYLNLQSWLSDIEKADSAHSFRYRMGLLEELDGKRADGVVSAEDFEDTKSKLLKSLE